MRKKDQAQMGRLALREKDDMWIAYYALNDTMDGAIKLGSIALGFVSRPDRKKQFIELMRECMGDLIQREFGVRPSWGNEQRAPEHERIGSPDGR